MLQKLYFCNMKNIPAWRPDQPFDDLPLLPPTIEIETKIVLKQCITSRSALAGLNQAMELIPNAAMLLNTLPMLEAQASSEIENIVTTTDNLFQYAHDDSNANPATKEALRYRRALADGAKSLETRPLTTRTAETICTQIMGEEMTVRRVPGTKIGNHITREVIYTPPEGE